MSDVKRWTVNECGDANKYMVPHSDGAWVHIDDYRALHSQVRELKKLIVDRTEDARMLSGEVSAAQAIITALEAEVHDRRGMVLRADIRDQLLVAELEVAQQRITALEAERDAWQKEYQEANWDRGKAWQSHSDQQQLITQLEGALKAALQTMTWFLPKYPKWTDNSGVQQDPNGLHASIQQAQHALTPDLKK